jgi:hypothetical protein
LKNGDLLRQRENPDRFCMRKTPRALFFSLPRIAPFLNDPRPMSFSAVS